MAIGPAIVAGIAAAGAVAKSIGGKVKPGYRPSKRAIRGYEGHEYEDIQRLYKKDPYSGDDLGFNKNQMAAQMGEEGRESQSEYKSDLGQLERETRGSGLRTVSGAYFRGRQRVTEAHLGRIADIRRRNLIADALQRREDFGNRLRSVQSAYRYGTSLLGSKKQSQGLEAAGEGLQGFASAYGKVAGGG